MRAEGLGFRVWALGFRVSGLGFGLSMRDSYWGWALLCLGFSGRGEYSMARDSLGQSREALLRIAWGGILSEILC